ncbi:MAG: SUMF1/EgtB/PvdO family nonheme iron enzyme [Thiothrix sp.]|uniref:SUMF1/EgtB/PvdO family nonheme iron enzyme n=1 Tax=Thiothrix sp. TaxID=1032 RepID=UPI0026202B78|nr:SUMF1/EgtB/PvdO family nonheme iron enzyme [Thiothrix sp.]MDD5392320.1 SUMF1/EgtB/PvdO family nonheme iron enzyme [Thiothrix sp.]
MQSLWTWIWGNIQSIEALAAFVLILWGLWWGVWGRLRKPPVVVSEPTPVVPQPARDLTVFYYAGLDASCEMLKLNLIEKRLGDKQAGRLGLSEIYQDQRIRLPESGDKAKAGEHLRESKDAEPLMEALNKLESRRLVILGKLGSGKSSFVNYVTHCIIQSRSKPVANLPSFMSNRPIVRLLLREVGLHVDSTSNSNGLIWRELKAGVQQQIEKHLLSQGEMALKPSEFEQFWPAFQRDFIQQNGILLLDGLDEVSREDAVAALREGLLAFAADKANQNVFIVVTSRPSAYEREEQRLPGFLQTELEPMNEDQIRAFIRQWYQVIESSDPTQATKRADDLARDIFDNPALKERKDLQEMAERPLLLTLLIGLNSAGKSLNRSRPEVYREIIELLLQRWQENLREHLPSLRPELQEGMRVLQKSPDALMKSLQKTAYETYESLGSAGAGNAVLEFSAAIALGNLYGKCESDNLNHVLEFLQDRSTLLVAGNQPGKLQFAHKSFHEYLAARHLFNEADWEEQITRLLLANPQWWREVFLFMAKDEADGRYGKAVAFLHDALLGGYKRDDVAQQRLLILAAEAAMEMELPDNLGKRTHEELYRFLQTELVLLLPNSDLAVVECAEAGRLLGELGDPRPGVGVIRDGESKGLPDIDWVRIPSGRLRMGFEADENQLENWDKHAKPAHDVALPVFLMSRFPVTNAQFACFVGAGGYQDELYWKTSDAGFKWWKQREVRFPVYWDQRKWSNPNHPVVGVCWYEALAFCEWLNRMGNLHGQRVRLPTEAEWEYAARGADGWRYAWGNEADPRLGNYDDTGLGQTSAVGLFPAGKAFGLQDMTGNVWEWTTSQWGKDWQNPEFTYDKWDEEAEKRDNLNSDGDVLRIIRGGSWVSSSGFVRCAVRYWNHPLSRSGDLGFRVVLGE